MLKFWSDKFKKFVNKLISKRANIILKIQSITAWRRLASSIQNIWTKQNNSMHNLRSYMYSACCIKVHVLFWKNILFTRLLLHARTQSVTVAHGRTSSHMVGHGRTSSHKYFAQKLPHTVAQKLMLIAHGRTQSHRRPCTVEHGCTDDRTQSHTVAQKTAHGRTKNPQLPEWPTLSTMALSHTHQMSINFMYTPECTHHTAGRLCWFLLYSSISSGSVNVWHLQVRAWIVRLLTGLTRPSKMPLISTKMYHS